MRNAVIAVLAVFCGFLLLHALGAFEFGSLIDREHRSHYATMRERAVNASPHYILGAVYNKGDWAEVKTMEGAVLAVDMLNAKKPAKPFKLVTRDTGDSKTHNNAAVQTFADAHDTAAVIGPFESMHIPASRALTQFYGLPLLSPVTVASERLPALEPDNFVTVFPPLERWTKAVLDHMERHGVKNLFILSSGAGTYGDIFCTELERAGHSRLGFDQIFRLNYQDPLRPQDIERLLRSYVGNQKFDALFFGGKFEDFVEFSALLQESGITLPVYGTDDLYSPEVKERSGAFVLYLPRAEWKNANTDFDRQWRERHKTEPSYHARFGAETVFLLNETLERLGRYDPQGLVDAMRTAVHEKRSDPGRASRIVIDAFTGQEARTSVE